MAKPERPNTNHIPTTAPVSTYPATLAPHTTAAAERPGGARTSEARGMEKRWERRGEERRDMSATPLPARKEARRLGSIQNRAST